MSHELKANLWSLEVLVSLCVSLCGLSPQGHPANTVTFDRVTPLHEACLAGHVACVRALINAGASVSNQMFQFKTHYNTLCVIRHSSSHHSVCDGGYTVMIWGENKPVHSTT